MNDSINFSAEILDNSARARRMIINVLGGDVHYIDDPSIQELGEYFGQKYIVGEIGRKLEKLDNDYLDKVMNLILKEKRLRNEE